MELLKCLNQWFGKIKTLTWPHVWHVSRPRKGNSEVSSKREINNVKFMFGGSQRIFKLVIFNEIVWSNQV